MTIHHEPDRILVIRDVVDMYWAMRIFGNVCALAGNYQETWKEGEVLMTHLDDFSSYTDEGLRKALLQPADQQVVWLEKNDTATRSRMIEPTRAPTKMPWGLALRQARQELHYQWNARPGGMIVSGETAMGLQEVVPGSRYPGDSNPVGAPVPPPQPRVNQVGDLVGAPRTKRGRGQRLPQGSAQVSTGDQANTSTNSTPHLRPNTCANPTSKQIMP